MSSQYLDSMALTWAQRAQAELGASARFSILSEQLADNAALEKVIALAERAREDEDRHAVLCSQVARDLGHPTGFVLFEGQKDNTIKSWDRLSSERDRLLCEMVLMCCITETINASLLTSIYSSMSSSPTQRIIQEILKDEVKHSQMGWAHLTAELKNRDCSFVSQHLREMLDLAVKDELFLPAPIQGPENQSFEYGIMPVEQRLNQFTWTLTEIVLPGFENLRLDISQAQDWLNSKMAQNNRSFFDDKSNHP